MKAEGGRKRTGTPQVQVKKGKKRIEGQREMLLPIPGKKDKETAAKSTARSSGRHKKADNEGIAVTYPASALVGLFGQLHSSLNGGSLPHGGMVVRTPEKSIVCGCAGGPRRPIGLLWRGSFL